MFLTIDHRLRKRKNVPFSTSDGFSSVRDRDRRLISRTRPLFTNDQPDELSLRGVTRFAVRMLDFFWFICRHRRAERRAIVLVGGASFSSAVRLVRPPTHCLFFALYKVTWYICIYCLNCRGFFVWMNKDFEIIIGMTFRFETKFSKLDAMWTLPFVHAFG